MRSLTFRKIVDPRYTSEKRGSRRRRGRKMGKFGERKEGEKEEEEAAKTIDTKFMLREK